MAHKLELENFPCDVGDGMKPIALNILALLQEIIIQF